MCWSASGDSHGSAVSSSQQGTDSHHHQESGVDLHVGDIPGQMLYRCRRAVESCHGTDAVPRAAEGGLCPDPAGREPNYVLHSHPYPLTSLLVAPPIGAPMRLTLCCSTLFVTFVVTLLSRNMNSVPELYFGLGVGV